MARAEGASEGPKGGGSSAAKMEGNKKDQSHGMTDTGQMSVG